MSALDRLAATLADRYRLERELGAGGMANVYLAHDVRHDRKVALKVLKPDLAAVLGAERFVSEIKTTAALQHPHVLPLFDSGTADGFLFYVMPYVEGETLRARLDRERQLGIEEAVRIAREVADALDYAHRHGVIHRDIKPENILLHDGRATVADFGIALAVSAAAGGRMTETGLSLGTPHYMSPEQATAEREITGRSDIYSLGCVLYEMLTGNPPHVGATAQQIIMKIVTDEAAPVTKLRKSVPANVTAAVAKALEKLAADRFDSAKAFADALANPRFSLPERTDATSLASDRRWKRRFQGAVALIALLLAALSAVVGFGRRPGPASGTVRFMVTGPLDSTLVETGARDASWVVRLPTVAPGGRHVAFQVTRSSGTAIYLRAVDSFDLREIEGEAPFFSPTGQELGFLRSEAVWTQTLADRVPTRISTVPEVPWNIVGGAWHPDGRILLSGARGLWAFPARGGAPSLILPVDSAKGERFGEIALMDDGQLLLNVEDRTGRHLEVVSSDGRERTRILPGAETGGIVGDILIYRQAGQDRATRFDLRRLEPVGQPVPLPELPTSRLAASIAWVAPEDRPRRELVWVAKSGRATPIGLPAATYRWPRLSPGGQRIVVDQGVETARQIAQSVREIVVRDLLRGTLAPLRGFSEPVWSADGLRVYMSRGDAGGGLLAQVADASRPPDTLLVLDQGDSFPTSASPDGRWLAWYGRVTDSGTAVDATDPHNDLFFLDLIDRASRRIRLPGTQRGARFSPDGRWVAYQSTESGREEVFVRPWPSLDANYLISNGGGTEPIWAPDGRELYYRRQNEIMAATVTVRDRVLEKGPARVLFSGPFLTDVTGDQSWDVAPDGRFLMMRAVPGGRAIVRVALHWIAEVRARLEAAQ